MVIENAYALEEIKLGRRGENQDDALQLEETVVIGYGSVVIHVPVQRSLRPELGNPVNRQRNISPFL